MKLNRLAGLRIVIPLALPGLAQAQDPPSETLSKLVKIDGPVHDPARHTYLGIRRSYELTPSGRQQVIVVRLRPIRGAGSTRQSAGSHKSGDTGTLSGSHPAGPFRLIRLFRRTMPVITRAGNNPLTSVAAETILSICAI